MGETHTDGPGEAVVRTNDNLEWYYFNPESGPVLSSGLIISNTLQGAIDHEYGQAGR